MADRDDGLIDPGGVISPIEEKFEHVRKLAGIVLAPIAFALTYWLCDGLTPEGRSLSGILATVGVLWLTEVLPLPATALLGALLCIVLGVADAKKVFAYFGDPIVFVFVGSFMLAKAMSVHALDRRIALGFLAVRGVAGSPAGILFGMGAVTAFLSMWVSNTATTAMMLPIALGMLGALHRLRVGQNLAVGEMNARAWPFATAMMLMIAYGASIGGIGTPVGSPPNLIGIAQIERATGVHVSFATWMLLCVPLLTVMFGVLFVILLTLHPGTTQKTVGGEELAQYLDEERRKLGRWTAGQRNTLLVFLLAVSLWVLPGVLALPGFAGSSAETLVKARLPESAVAILAAVLLFVLPIKLSEARFTLSWADAVRIDWGTIILFGGGLAMGGLMMETGVAKALGDAVTARSGVSSVWAITALSIGLAIVISEAASNTASAQMIIPVVIGIAHSAGVDPMPPALGAVLGASYGFMLPVSTPPNAIVYGSGLVPIGRMIRAGILFDLLGFFIILGGLRLIYPLITWR
ncbi:MAG: DASS family sodium-coupled anion symporter [Phycisphaerales bacterium]|nr:DASS family sodium-coupled anion symporter [Phycisphaerales bacterium]